MSATFLSSHYIPVMQEQPGFVHDTPQQEGKLQSNILRFVSGYYPEQSIILKPPNGRNKGMSKDPVYFVWSQNTTEPLSVAKAFQKENEFYNECKAIAILKHLELENSDHIEILTAKKIPHDRQDYFFMLQSLAKGKGVDDLIEEYADYKLRTDEDHDNFKEIIGKVASAFAELHIKTISSEWADISKYIGRTNGTDRIGGIDAKEAKELLGDSAVGKIELLIDQNKNGPGCGSIIHGDGHPGNLFADPNSEFKTTFIDTPSLTPSVREDSIKIELVSAHVGLDHEYRLLSLPKGISPPSRDYSKFIFRVHDIIIRKFTQYSNENEVYQKYRQISDLFYKRVEMEINSVIPNHSKALQTIWVGLGAIIKSQNNLSQLSASDYSKELKVIQINKIILNETLNELYPGV